MRKTHRLRIAVMAGGAILVSALASAGEPLSFAERARAFDYDVKAPLDLQELSVETCLLYTSPSPRDS